ncbi:MAG TPA: 50S ribosomal protein L11 methyltransferase, partial [Saprospiraceae bacterium]|nr:50S ribosomal protein L11 methyltransferase [Saprospiraceae bacterium]
MSKFLKVSISKNDEVLLAHLSLLPFDSFQENDNGTLDAYIAYEEWTSFVQNEVNDVASMFDANVEVSELENKNWNEEWETNFTPVEVDDFVRIRADFHPSIPGFEYELTIHPKMAFGTGHHQTTYTMIKAMRTLQFVGKNVFDFGCGTGYFVFPIAKRVSPHGTIWALDILKQKIEIIESQAKLSGITNIIAKRANLEKEKGSSLPKESIDWVIMVNMLFQNDDKNSILTEAKRVLKKSGKILLVEWNEKNLLIG